mgnify:FL=1
MVEVMLRTVRMDASSGTPVLLLEEVHGPRALAVFIGGPEAAAIAYALEGVQTPRPMTHDLLASTIMALGARLLTVEIVEQRDSSYIALLRLVRDGAEVAVDTRPSDAIALALRQSAPILVDDKVMEECSFDTTEEEESEEVDEAALVDELRAFLETVKPEDFES